MRALAALLLAAALPADAPPQLTLRHTHPSGVFSFMTPPGWTLRAVEGRTDLYEAAGDGQIVRFVYTTGDVGYDSLHVTCMLERLLPEQDASPHLRYEYDFLSAVAGDYRILDSAFEITYDAPIAGQHEWRQRNVTLVGKGHSLCVILHAPLKTWRKSKAARALQEAVLRSVTLP
ncbi:MAG TPA: hypothetical protein VFM88_11365 [Vicinamibacteria bacterium]|nr:hypothetical protein [Vicinamibacteria bacterium]